MSKTLWHTIKLEVPKEMVNITKNDKVVVKKTLTKTNNISKANKEPSIKIIPGDTNKPKIISDGKEWNIEELKIRMKKAKELGKKNEGKEYKKEMTKDKAAKIITSEINSRAKLNRADKYLQLKNNSLEELKTIFASLDIDVRIIGEEYKDKNFTAKDICMKRNIRFVYNKRDHDFSTSSLRKRIYEQESTKRFVK